FFCAGIETTTSDFDMREVFIMKRLSLAMAIVTLLFTSMSLQAGVANPADEVLARMQSEGQKIKTFSANISQVKRNTQLGGSDSASGNIVLQRAGEKAHIKLNNGNEVSIVGNQIILYQPRIGQAIHTTRTKQASDNPAYNFVATPFTSTAQLKAN